MSAYWTGAWSACALLLQHHTPCLELVMCLMIACLPFEVSLVTFADPLDITTWGQPSKVSLCLHIKGTNIWHHLLVSIATSPIHKNQKTPTKTTLTHVHRAMHVNSPIAFKCTNRVQTSEAIFTSCKTKPSTRKDQST